MDHDSSRCPKKVAKIIPKKAAPKVTDTNVANVDAKVTKTDAKVTKIASMKAATNVTETKVEQVEAKVEETQTEATETPDAEETAPQYEEDN